MDGPAAPSGLGLGAHLCPEDGACLMEVVSALAGEAWSDHPACTHPLLAHLARLVNDSMSDHGRQRLLPRAVPLTTANSDDPATSARLASACTQVGLRVHASPLLRHLDRISRAHADPQRDCRSDGLRHRLYLRGPAHRAVEAAVIATGHLDPSDRDTALERLLDLGLATVLGTRDVTALVRNSPGTSTRWPAG